MKKLASLAIAGLAVTAFAACGDDDTPSNDTTPADDTTGDSTMMTGDSTMMTGDSTMMTGDTTAPVTTG